MRVVVNRSILVGVFVMLASMAGAAWAGDVVVVANKGIGEDHLSKKEIKSIFLGKKKSLGGITIQLAVLTGNAKTVHGRFLETYLKKSPSKFNNYYKKRVFTGKGKEPKSFASEAGLLAFVARTKGAIGYASANVVTDRVKTIEISD